MSLGQCASTNPGPRPNPPRTDNFLSGDPENEPNSRSENSKTNPIPARPRPKTASFSVVRNRGKPRENKGSIVGHLVFKTLSRDPSGREKQTQFPKTEPDRRAGRFHGPISESISAVAVRHDDKEGSPSEDLTTKAQRPRRPSRRIKYSENDPVFSHSLFRSTLCGLCVLCAFVVTPSPPSCIDRGAGSQGALLFQSLTVDGRSRSDSGS